MYRGNIDAEYVLGVQCDLNFCLFRLPHFKYEALLSRNQSIIIVGEGFCLLPIWYWMSSQSGPSFASGAV